MPIGVGAEPRIGFGFVWRSSPREEDLSGIRPEGPSSKRTVPSQLLPCARRIYHNAISDSYYNITSLATSIHCDFGSSFFEEPRSAFCLSMAVSTCHIARSSSISS